MTISIPALLVTLLIGAIAGWLAGTLMRGRGFGLVGNILVGIVGAVVAGWILPAIGISIGGGLLGAVLHATIGAVIVLALVSLIRRG